MCTCVWCVCVRVCVCGCVWVCVWHTIQDKHSEFLFFMFFPSLICWNASVWLSVRWNCVPCVSFPLSEAEHTQFEHKWNVSAGVLVAESAGTEREDGLMDDWKWRFARIETVSVHSGLSKCCAGNALWIRWAARSYCLRLLQFQTVFKVNITTKGLT